jgi:hypothetical protein
MGRTVTVGMRLAGGYGRQRAARYCAYARTLLCWLAAGSHVVHERNEGCRSVIRCCSSCNDEDLIDGLPVVVTWYCPHRRAKQAAHPGVIHVAIPCRVQFCGKQVTMVLVAIIRQDSQSLRDCE